MSGPTAVRPSGRERSHMACAVRTRRAPLTVIEPPARDMLQHCRWSCAYECFHDAPNQSSTHDTFAAVLQRAVSRRAVLKGAAASVGTLAAGAMVRPLTAAAQSP